MKKYISDYAFLFTIAGAIVLLDQVSKFIVRTNLSYTESWSPWAWLAPYARIVNWHNTGAAFGIFQNAGMIFTILAIIVSGAILYYFPQIPKDDWALRVALGLQLGGALGNLIDRMTQGPFSQGPVTDFVSLGNFAVFNVADASISLGVVILVFSMWSKERKKSASQISPPTISQAPAQETSPNPQPEDPKGE